MVQRMRRRNPLGGTIVKKSKKYVSRNIGCNILVVG
jgi:hypothetical protein